MEHFIRWINSNMFMKNIDIMFHRIAKTLVLFVSVSGGKREWTDHNYQKKQKYSSSPFILIEEI